MWWIAGSWRAALGVPAVLRDREVRAVRVGGATAALAVVVADGREVHVVPQHLVLDIEELLPLILARAIVDHVSGPEDEVRNFLRHPLHDAAMRLDAAAAIADHHERERHVLADRRRRRELALPARAADLDAIAIAARRCEPLHRRFRDPCRQDLLDALAAWAGHHELRRLGLVELPHHRDRRRREVLQVWTLDHARVPGSRAGHAGDDAQSRDPALHGQGQRYERSGVAGNLASSLRDADARAAIADHLVAVAGRALGHAVDVAKWPTHRPAGFVVAPTLTVVADANHRKRRLRARLPEQHPEERRIDAYLDHELRVCGCGRPVIAARDEQAEQDDDPHPDGHR
jgi:hypothetical protein